MLLKIQTSPNVDWTEVMIEDNIYDKLIIFISHLLTNYSSRNAERQDPIIRSLSIYMVFIVV
jgi:hypothetical protein